MGESGEAEQTVWELLLDMERVKYQAGEKGPRNGSPGLGSGETFRAGQSSSGVGVSMYFPRKIWGGAMRILRASAACSLKDAWRSRSRPSQPSSLFQSGCCLLLRIVLQGRLDEHVSALKPQTLLEVFWTCLHHKRSTVGAWLLSRVLSLLPSKLHSSGSNLPNAKIFRRKRTSLLAHLPTLE